MLSVEVAVALKKLSCQFEFRLYEQFAVVSICYHFVESKSVEALAVETLFSEA